MSVIYNSYSEDSHTRAVQTMASERMKRNERACGEQILCQECSVERGKGWCQLCIAARDPEYAVRLQKEERKRLRAAAVQAEKDIEAAAQIEVARLRMAAGWIPNYEEPPCSYN